MAEEGHSAAIPPRVALIIEMIEKAQTDAINRSVTKYHEENKKIISGKLKAMQLEEEIISFENEKVQLEAELEALEKKKLIANEDISNRPKSGSSLSRKKSFRRDRATSLSENDLLEMQIKNTREKLGIIEQNIRKKKGEKQPQLSRHTQSGFENNECKLM